MRAFLKGELFQLHLLVFQICLKRPRKDIPLLVSSPILWVKLGKLFHTKSLEIFLGQPLITGYRIPICFTGWVILAKLAEDGGVRALNLRSSVCRK